MKTLLAMVVLAMLPATTAMAHPHIWISQLVRPIAKGGLYTHVEIEWRFDPLASEQEIPPIDENHDGRISTEEVRLLARDMIPELEKTGYMTWFNIGGQDFRPSKPPTVTVRIDNPATFTPADWDRNAGDQEAQPTPSQAGQKHDPRNLVYVMRFELPKPVKFLSVTTIDTEDFIRVEVDKASLPAGCTAAKHPTLKSEFVPGKPVFADRTSCRLR